MNSSFYTAAVGAYAHQSKLNVISNNMANINTTAFKSATPVFADLLYTNQPDAQGGVLQRGHGVKLDKTDITFSNYGAPQPTENNLDFAINGPGFFAVQDLDGEDTYYTRDGRFRITNIDDTLYLTTYSGQIVLSPDGEAIEIDEEMAQQISDMDGELEIGVYRFPIENGLIPVGFSNYQPTEKNGDPESVEDPVLLRGYLEASNVDMAGQMTQIIEAQRAFSYALKMVQTSDEVEQEINSLRR